MQVGYARVSTQDQDLTVQRDRLASCEKLFERRPVARMRPAPNFRHVSTMSARGIR